MNGYYEIKNSKNKKFIFNLRAGNHEVILSSQVYASRASALEGIASVQKHGPKKAFYEKKTSDAKQPFFVLKAANSQVIGKSEMYASWSGRTKGIASVMANSRSKVIKEVSE